MKNRGSKKGKKCGTRRHRYTRGSRAEVMHGTKDRTSGGLAKRDLKYNKHGRIVSKAKVALAKKQQHLEKAGYFAEKGKFGYVRNKPVKCKRTRRTRRAARK